MFIRYCTSVKDKHSSHGFFNRTNILEALHNFVRGKTNGNRWSLLSNLGQSHFLPSKSSVSINSLLVGPEIAIREELYCFA